MHHTRGLAVGLCDFILACLGLDADEGVEGGIGALGLLYLVAQTEDLVVFL